MRNKSLTILAILIFTASLISAQSKHETTVAAAVESLRKAMIDPDKTILDILLDANLSYGHSGGKVEDKASLIDALSTAKSDFVTIELTDQTISFFGKTAVVRHKLNATTNDGGKPGAVKLAILTVWQKNGRQWKMIARQAVKI